LGPKLFTQLTKSTVKRIAKTETINCPYPTRSKFCDDLHYKLVENDVKSLSYDNQSHRAKT
jgi:hypothetical protein